KLVIDPHGEVLETRPERPADILGYDRVGPARVGENVIRVVDVVGVVAGAAVHRVDVDVVVSGAVLLGRPVQAVERVVAVATTHRISTSTTDDRIVAAEAIDRVGAGGA